LGGQRLRQQRQSLHRFLDYVLGHRPDEFGLIADEQGFIPLKDLLRALSEEEGWKHVRLRHIEDMMRETDERFEIKDKLIRVWPRDTHLQLGPLEPVLPPKLLYHAARRKGYPSILEHGLSPGAKPWVPLAVNPELALRLGRRRDTQPILLTIQAAKAADRRIPFYRPQELIYLVDSLPVDLFAGPPLPKEKALPEKKKTEAPPPAPRHPGSFFLDLDQDPDQDHRRQAKKKRKKGDIPDWKRSTRRERRRQKQDF